MAPGDIPHFPWAREPGRSWLETAILSEWICRTRVGGQNEDKDRAMGSAPSSPRRWYGFHAFQFSHSDFLCLLDIPGNGSQGEKPRQEARLKIGTVL